MITTEAQKRADAMRVKIAAAIAVANAVYPPPPPVKLDVKTIADRAPVLVLRARDVYRGTGIDARRAAALALAMDGDDEQAALRRIGTMAFRELLEKTNLRGRRDACIGGTATIRNK